MMPQIGFAGNSAAIPRCMPVSPLTRNSVISYDRPAKCRLANARVAPPSSMTRRECSNGFRDSACGIATGEGGGVVRFSNSNVGNAEASA